ncbi:hypothetical protein [Algibacter sp. R77976]|uniref:hypothetical protein n=1 Tax=Algibacter sp. R77976 TaxID=3093873 RepID=UPI0037C98DE6
MDDFRNRPKENFIQEANWNELYLLTESWKNDLDFYLFEIKFMESLIENRFSELLLFENLDELRELQIDVYELKNQCEHLLNNSKNNLESIVDIINDTYILNTSRFRSENEQLEENIIHFINKEREIKRCIFSMIKNILEKKKEKNSWMFN